MILGKFKLNIFGWFLSLKESLASQTIRLTNCNSVMLLHGIFDSWGFPIKHSGMTVILYYHR